MTALMEAFTASKAYLGEKALDVNFVRERLGDDPITVLDVSQNDLGLVQATAEGSGMCDDERDETRTSAHLQKSGCAVLMEALLSETSNWCLTTLKIGSNNLRDKGCEALLALFSSESKSGTSSNPWHKLMSL